MQVGHLIVSLCTFAFAIVARTISFDTQALSTTAAIWSGAAVLSTLIYNPAAIYVQHVRKRPNSVDPAKGELFNVTLLILYSLSESMRRIAGLYDREPALNVVVAITSIVHISLPCSESDCNPAWSIVTIVFGFIGVITSFTWLVVDVVAIRAAKKRGAVTVWKENMWVLIEENRAAGKRYGLTMISSGV